MKDLDIPLNSERDLTIPALNLEQNFTTTTPGDYPDIYKNQLQQSINNTPSDTITCYTDGSKTDKGANNNLELRWIAAHTGLWGNEKADELAKLGTTSNLILKRPVPQSHINNYINNKVIQLNNEHWTKNGPKHTKMILGRNSDKTINNIKSSLINNRKDYRTAVQLITGHCFLNKHLFNMKKSDTMECPLCGHREETVSHFLGQCPATTQLRRHYFNEYYLSINDIFDYIHIGTIIKYKKQNQKKIKLVLGLLAVLRTVFCSPSEGPPARVRRIFRKMKSRLFNKCNDVEYFTP
ncbi:hypothetical protein ACHWQZ_G016900 [Mnemiopsis leidyi]